MRGGEHPLARPVFAAATAAGMCDLPRPEGATTFTDLAGGGRTVANMRQNVVIALVAVFLLHAGVLVGGVTMAVGMLVHQLSILIVIVNAMRLLPAPRRDRIGNDGEAALADQNRLSESATLSQDRASAAKASTSEGAQDDRVRPRGARVS